MPEELIIAIAEDDSDDFLFIREALMRNEFTGQLRCLENGQLLLSFLYEDHEPPQVPSLVVLDLNMPFKDGYETLEEIRKDPKLEKIPVVVLTSSYRPEDEVRCRSLGAEGFLRKPLSLEGYDEVAASLLTYIRRN